MCNVKEINNAPRYRGQRCDMKTVHGERTYTWTLRIPSPLAQNGNTCERCPCHCDQQTRLSSCEDTGSAILSLMAFGVVLVWAEGQTVCEPGPCVGRQNPHLEGPCSWLNALLLLS